MVFGAENEGLLPTGTANEFAISAVRSGDSFIAFLAQHGERGSKAA
jgi:diacylglycerol kinase family enzyme